MGQVWSIIQHESENVDGLSDDEMESSSESESSESEKEIERVKFSHIDGNTVSLGGLREIFRTKVSAAKIPRLLNLHPENDHSLGIIHPKAKFQTYYAPMQKMDPQSDIPLLPTLVWGMIIWKHIMKADTGLWSKQDLLQSLRGTCKCLYWLIVLKYTNTETGMVDVQRWWESRTVIKGPDVRYNSPIYVQLDTDHWCPEYPVPWHRLEYKKKYNILPGMLNGVNEPYPQISLSFDICKSYVDSEALIYFPDGWYILMRFNHYIILSYGDTMIERDIDITLYKTKNETSTLELSRDRAGTQTRRKFNIRNRSDLEHTLLQYDWGAETLRHPIFSTCKGKWIIYALHDALYRHFIYFFCGNFNNEFAGTTDIALRVMRMRQEFAEFKKARAKQLAQKNKKRKRVMDELG